MRVGGRQGERGDEGRGQGESKRLQELWPDVLWPDVCPCIKADRDRDRDRDKDRDRDGDKDKEACASRHTTAKENKRHTKFCCQS